MNGLLAPSIPSIQGAWDVLRFRDSGFARIDGSQAGFRRSWAALVLALPFIGLSALAVAKVTLDEPKLPDVPVYAAFAGALFQWLIGAGCLALIAVVFGRAERLQRLIACDNWITLWLLVLEAPFQFLTATGLLGPLGGIGSAVLSVYGLVVGARMLLVILELPMAAVIGIIIFLLLIQLSLLQIVQGISA